MLTSVRARLSLMATVAFASPVYAQGALTGVILTGAGSATRGTPAPPTLVPGVRVQGGASSWTEIALSDGSSVVLAPGASFTMQSMQTVNGRRVLTAAGDGGRMRIVASENLEVRLRTPDGEVRIGAGTAVVEAGRDRSVTLLSGERVSVVRGGRETTVRRPGFAIDLASGRTERQSRTRLVEDVDSFAPVSDAAIAAASTQSSSAQQTSTADNAQSDPPSRSQRASTASDAGGRSAAVTTARQDAAQSTTATATVSSAPGGSVSATVSTASISTTAAAATTANPTASQTASNSSVIPNGGTAATQQRITLGTAEFSLINNETTFDANAPFTVAAPGKTTSTILKAGQRLTVASTTLPSADAILKQTTANYQHSTGTIQPYSITAGGTNASGLAVAYASGSAAQIADTSLFVIDGRSTSSSDNTRFLVVGGQPYTSSLGSALPGQAIGTIARFAITDGLGAAGSSVSAGLAAGRTVASQYPTASAFTGLASFSPFPSLLAQGGSVPLADTGLLVVSDPARNNPSLRSELQIAPDGRSAASVAVGGLYSPSAGGNVALNARVVASGQPTTSAGPLAYVANLGSPGVDSTTGATTQAVYRTNTGATTPVGAFAVKNDLSSVYAAGTQNAQTFSGYTRLATNVGSGAAEPTGQLNLSGFASAVVQSTNGQPQLYAVGTDGTGVRITGPASGSALYATLNLQATGLGSLTGSGQTLAAPSGISPPSQPLSFGNSNYTVTGAPRTAVASLATFAAVGDGAALASVNADMLAKLAAGLPDAASLPPSNEHVAWGYFLGDLTNQASQSSGNYTNLGFWVAGQQVPREALVTLTGRATYSGGMIGTAVSSNGTAARAGSFNQSWDFKAMTGSMNATFDGANWGGVNLTLGSGNTYAGTGIGSGRTLSVNGAFFNNATTSPLTPTGTPAATGGLFAIGGANYGANGIFVGARRP